MSWSQFQSSTWFMTPRMGKSVSPLSVNEKCFIRKEHECGKMRGASKSCFIACPSVGVETILDLMSEKLSKFGFDPVIAMKERAYGQDIFCTKICGKIIEAKFCIVILDDTIVDGKSIPNPNVYYEYGLMTSLGKHIIPLQSEGLNLAFNIQSYDTIKYNDKTIGPELDRAIKDAIRITDSQEDEEKDISPPEKTILQRLELANLQIQGNEWFMHFVVEDTCFIAFGQYDKGFYVYLGKIDDQSEFQNCIEDLGVVLFRTEKKAKKLASSLLEAQMKISELEASMNTSNSSFVTLFNDPFQKSQVESQMSDAKSKISDIRNKQSLMDTIYVGFIIGSGIDTTDFLKKVKDLLKQYKRYVLAVSGDGELKFGDTIVNLLDDCA